MIIEAIAGKSFFVEKEAGKDVLNFASKFLEVEECYVHLLSTNNPFNLEILLNNSYNGFVNLSKLNNSRRINQFLEITNSKLVVGGIYISCVETYANRRKTIFEKYFKPLNYFFYLMDTIFHRIIPKLKLTQKGYFYLTKGKGRMLSRAETFGRLYSCGFEVLDQFEHNNKVYFAAKKIGLPVFDKYPTYGPLIKLRRVGKNGKVFKVYKFRTMYPYAEYLQDYVYKNNALDEGGKFKDDFRVSPLGKIFRKFWIDELPMIWNLIKGDMKLIGVRPLSSHYFALYTPEIQELRTKVKPGLVPPFYADMPKTLDEIMLSEKKYLELYFQNPLRTDISYFFKIFKNILFKGARSK
jgi:lipopolysaccharide/colanic/teichoic acid biosynthesis glycosyltransferase